MARLTENLLLFDRREQYHTYIPVKILIPDNPVKNMHMPWKNTLRHDIIANGLDTPIEVLLALGPNDKLKFLILDGYKRYIVARLDNWKTIRCTITS